MNINLITPLNQSGYGQSGIGFAVALRGLGHDVSLFPLGRTEVAEASKAEDVAAAIRRSDSFDGEAPSVRIWHAFGLAEHVGRGPRFGLPFFEMDRLGPREVHQINGLDALLATSEWGRGVCEESGVTVPIHIVPLGVDREIFHEGVGATRADDDTVFFNVGKWERRKGHDVLLAAFNRAFDRTDRVALKLIPHNQWSGTADNDRWARLYRESKLGEKITLAGRMPTQRDVARFMAGGDVGVFPARSEGWNLDLLEAMSLGKPVIATDYAAHRAYCTTENCTLIGVDRLEDAVDGIFFHGDGRWAELGAPQEEQLVEAMRAAHRLKQSGRLAPNEAGIATARSLGWDEAARKMVDAVASSD